MTHYYNMMVIIPVYSGMKMLISVMSCVLEYSYLAGRENIGQITDQIGIS
jgi:hypothetical protein